MGESNLPPTRTPEQRKEAMARAVHTRRERAAFKAACKAGSIPPEAAIEAPIAQRLKVEEFARSFPGIGPVTAQKIVEVCHIRDGRRVSGLGYMQGPRLVAFIKNNMTAKEDGQ
ncbi:integration host factor, actinobacterial type [Adlercreutzia sp.]|uniref:integration host factor, actinobacterial type n=1 Tax=Adlercreutzia sp. TaxID=1872387 RepID=UPI003FD7878C